MSAVRAAGVPKVRGSAAARWSSAIWASVGVLCLVALSLHLAPAADEPGGRGPGSGERLVTFEVRTAADLCRILDGVWGLAAQSGEIPNVAPGAFPADLCTLDASLRRQTFIRSVAPHVLENNRKIAEERKALLEIRDRVARGGALSPGDQSRIGDWCQRYRLELAGETAAADPARAVAELLRRMDEIPLNLAVGQAALESAWGTSRLALEENSLFGQFVFPSDDPGPPLGKGARRPGQPARFRHIGEAVEAYFRNLNTCAAYEPFRKLRAGMRRRGKSLDSATLAQGLLPYSELGAYYVETVREVIRANNVSAMSSAPMAKFERTLLSALFRGPAAAVASSEADIPPEA